MKFYIKARNFEPQSISVLILYFSVQVLTIKMHPVTPYDTTNLRSVSKAVTHTINLHDARRSFTITATSINVENTLFPKCV
jgi:hypothetical protein